MQKGNSSANWFFKRIAGIAIAAAGLVPCTAASGQALPAEAQAVIQGTVKTSTGKPASGVTIQLNCHSGPLMTTTDAAGRFGFSIAAGSACTVNAQSGDERSVAQSLAALSAGETRQVNLVLRPSNDAQSTMEFSDKPNFTVAGVTDWTAVGGHGSDATLRTSEDLPRETLSLKTRGVAANASPAGVEEEKKLRAAVAAAPESFSANHQLGAFCLNLADYKAAVPPLKAAYLLDPADRANEHDLALALSGVGEYKAAREHVERLLAAKDEADLRRLAAEIDEQLGDPLSAVREDEQAVHLDHSEQNYFAWGSELLLHRAVWQAVDVFRQGTKAYPQSSRLLTALGTALFAGARYDEAAEKLCAASDLDPANPEPYTFMGNADIAAPDPLPCVESKLARFVTQHPESAQANYLLAMAVLKRHEQSEKAEVLFKEAVRLDPQLAEAYLQLGILAASQHNYPEAMSYYQKAIVTNPKLGEAHYRLGVIYDRSGKPDLAKQEFKLHEDIEKEQAEEVERERREVKQFLIVLHSRPGSSGTTN